MCSIFSAQKPEAYAYQTRSVRLGGHATSIRLEATFWSILEEIAEKQHVSVPRFLTKLYDEVLDFNGEVANFASLLRCACITYTAQVKGDLHAESELDRQGRRSFPQAYAECQPHLAGEPAPWAAEFCDFLAAAPKALS